MGKHLLVIDGADKDRTYLLEQGKVLIGSSRKNTNICLHDLLVNQVHCELQVSPEQILVIDVSERDPGILLNGQRVLRQEMKLGDVLRVGNSFLRLQDDDEEVVEAEEVATPPPVYISGPLPRLPSERLHELTMHIMGHFEIDQVLGKGRFGVVFRARDTKADRVVALKVLGPQFPSNADEMQRFVQAIKAIPARHPHLVNLIGAGKTGPYSWIALEYVEGESLAQMMERVGPGGRIGWKRGLRVAVHIGRALDFIHRKRFIHGNITPPNIMVQSGDFLAKLGDLTLAKALEGSALQQVILEGKLLAELPYLAPEQVSGGVIDNLTDIYSLGVVLYAMITGRPPYLAEFPEETLSDIQSGALVRPSSLQKGIPEGLEHIVVRMLAKDQVDRIQSAGEMVTELEALAEKVEVEV